MPGPAGGPDPDPVGHQPGRPGHHDGVHPDKAELSRQAGAVEVLDYPENPAEFAARVRDLTSGHGVAAVYDGVGKTTFDASLASLAVRGTLALFGASSGPVPPVDPQRLNAAGSVFLTRPNLAHFTRTADEFAWRAGEVLDAIADGSITVTVGGTIRWPRPNGPIAICNRAGRPDRSSCCRREAQASTARDRARSARWPACRCADTHARVQENRVGRAMAESTASATNTRAR